MISNDERREVAARLRETILTEGANRIERAMGIDKVAAARFVMIPNLISALNFDKAIVSSQELVDRLADLIEPEPERTCNKEQIPYMPGCYEGYWCSVCHCIELESDEPNYCQNCGAKVIE